jgi:hypothetical protein
MSLVGLFYAGSSAQIKKQYQTHFSVIFCGGLAATVGSLSKSIYSLITAEKQSQEATARDIRPFYLKNKDECNIALKDLAIVPIVGLYDQFGTKFDYINSVLKNPEQYENRIYIDPSHIKALKILNPKISIKENKEK